MKLPRYSLRTLLIAITLFAFWLGWEVHIVQLRRSGAARIVAAGGNIIWVDVIQERAPWAMNLPQIPWYRRWLGDRAAVHVNVFCPPSARDKIAAERVYAAQAEFPEARVSITESGIQP